MSARHRPQRRVRGRELEALLIGLAGHVVATAGLPPLAFRWRALALGCRPAQLRRCLLGLPVSARAAARILAAVSDRGG